MSLPKKNFFGRLMLDIEGESLSVEDQRLLLNPNVCGVILFARNYSSKRQLIDLTQHIKSISPQMLIGVDQEGGRVQRFQTDFVRLPSMQILGDMLSRSNESAINFIRDVGWLMATEIRSCFVDFSFAPVIDVDRFRSSVIGDRSFSENPDTVSLAAGAFINGIHDAGLPCVGKHFPGHGSVVEDSHIEHPVDYRSLEEITLHDLVPFQKLIPSLDAIMPAHMTFPKIDKNPVTYSSFWLRTVLRKNYEFKGIIFSDDLSMKGAEIAGAYRNRAKLAYESGCDVTLVCNCREGALEVLSFLEEHQNPSNDILNLMWRTELDDTIEDIELKRFERVREELNRLIPY